MNRKSSARQQALLAATELVESLDLSADEKKLVIGIAFDRFQSVRTTIENSDVNCDCISAVFAAALEYSETLNGHSMQ